MVYNQNFVVVLVCGGDILRELDGNTVRIPFGSEYSIRLKNKDARQAVASVNVDGEDATKFGRIIVPGGETVELEGMMDSDGKVKHKFRFIQKTEQISDYRGDKIDDGIVTVQYQFERHDPVQIDHHHHHHYGRHPRPNYPIFGGLLRGIKGSASMGAVETQGMAEYSASDIQVRDEAGITVPGSASGQQFSRGHTKPLESNIHTISIQLKGAVEAKGKATMVTKPVRVRTKLICPTCGTKSNSRAKFCPNCSTALQ